MADIRVFHTGEARALVALFSAVLGDSADALVDARAGPQAFLDDPAAFALGAYVDDQPAGLAWGAQMRSPGGRLTTYLHQLEVAERFRRRGLATALTNQAMVLGRRRGSTRFWLSTGGHNDGAQALYDSLGGDRKPLGDVNYWWTLDAD